MYLDGAAHPVIYGTGVEDLFNGGFYLDSGEKLFGSALAGLHSTAMHRLPADGVTLQSSLVAGLEGGPTGNLEMRTRVVSCFYSLPDPGLERVRAGRAVSLRRRQPVPASR